MQAVAPALNNIPPEILQNILFHVSDHDHLSVKLVSKTWNAWANVALPIARLSLNKTEAARCHTKIEATSIPRRRRLIYCVCIHCGKVKDKRCFSDNQAQKRNTTRICIACGIPAKKYTRHVLPKVHGKAYLPCWDCKQAVPEWHDWSFITDQARRHLKPTESLRAVQMFVAAFCKPCLESRLSFPVQRLQEEYDARCAAVNWDTAVCETTKTFGICKTNGCAGRIRGVDLG
ncbi:hypothetical protein MMC21_006199 [Puttea exsequens]|nr:hypothetical protein [Puttea exsequens]